MILADDLTGALDTGVQFVRTGTEVEVYLSLDDAMTQNPGESGNTRPKVNEYPQVDIRVINTDTRHVSPEEARMIVTSAIYAFRDCTHFYKKTDSCLRGNIGAELEALMEATGTPALAFVPAYPALKRTTRGGFQYIDGQLIHQSPMANDPLNPITDSFIPSIIARQSKIPVRLVGTYPAGTDPAGTDPRGTDPESLVGTDPAGTDLAGTDPRGTDLILVFDGETSAHLSATAKALLERGMLRVSAGCAGFAEALMGTLPFPQGDGDRNAFTPGDRLPILVVSGSVNPVSVGQVKAAMENDIPCFGVAEEDLLKEGWLGSKNALSLAADCRRALQTRGIAVLGTDLAVGTHAVLGTDLAVDKTHSIAPSAPANSQRIARQVADGLGKITHGIVNETGPLNLVVFGGDTLLGIMKTLGIRSLRPLKELYPGVVLAKNKNSSSYHLNIITKSGAFGDRGLILALEEFLRNRSATDK